MTNTFWEEQPGGLLLAVETVDISNPKHLETVVCVMHSTFQAVAQKHGANFEASGLRGNLNALISGRMHADLYLAKWKDCAEEVCVGAAFGWKTYGFTPNGSLVRAEYTEDVALPVTLLRTLIRKSDGGEFPEASLAQCFERISLRNMLQNRGASYRYGEVSPDNTTMVRQLYGNRAFIGTGPDSALVEFKRLPNNLVDSFPMNAVAFPIICDGLEDNNNFLVRWNEGAHDMRFVVTNAQATGKGKARVDLHGWDNGTSIANPIHECVIDSALLATKREVEERGWGEEKAAQFPNSLAALIRACPGLTNALYPEDYIISVSPNPKRTFPAPMPDETHVFIHKNRQLLNGVYAAGGVERVYGEKQMKPVVNILTPGLG